MINNKKEKTKWNNKQGQEKRMQNMIEKKKKEE